MKKKITKTSKQVLDKKERERKKYEESLTCPECGCCSYSNFNINGFLYNQGIQR